MWDPLRVVPTLAVEMGVAIRNAAVKGDIFSAPYHTYAVYVKEGIVLVYDPVFLPPPSATHSTPRIQGLFPL